MFILASPNWQRCAPITVTRERPIDIVGEPITISTGLNCLWEPVGLLIFT